MKAFLDIFSAALIFLVLFALRQKVHQTFAKAEPRKQFHPFK
jgi:hypothetical protein